MTGTGIEAVKRHTPVHAYLAAHPWVFTARLAFLSRPQRISARADTVQIFPPIWAVGKVPIHYIRRRGGMSCSDVLRHPFVGILVRDQWQTSSPASTWATSLR